MDYGSSLSVIAYKIDNTRSYSFELYGWQCGRNIGVRVDFLFHVFLPIDRARIPASYWTEWVAGPVFHQLRQSAFRNTRVNCCVSPFATDFLPIDVCWELHQSYVNFTSTTYLLSLLNVIILLIYDGNGQWFCGYVTGTDRRGKIFSNHPRNYDRWRIYVSHDKIWITYYIIDVNVIICCLTGNSLTTVNHLTRIFWMEKQQERNYWCK